MSEKAITCPICSNIFYPSEHPGCEACPLHKGCLMICCPSCGYSIVQPEQSTLVRWTSSLLKKSKGHDGKEPLQDA